MLHLDSVHSYPSRIEDFPESGRGLVAAAPLPAGTAVARFEGEQRGWRDVPADAVRHAILVDGDTWVVPHSPARWINHSCAPNCTVDDGLTVWTTRPVAAGEQLTISYDRVALADWQDAPEAHFWDERWSFDCRCGAAGCVGRVDRYRVEGYEGDAEVRPGAKVRLGISAGRGRGVFATQPIAAGELIERSPVLVSPAAEWPHLEKTVLYDYVFEWGEDETDSGIALGYAGLFNHSFTPNARYRRRTADLLIEVTAVREIAAGEEITMNYNGDPDDRTPVWFETK